MTVRQLLRDFINPTCLLLVLVGGSSARNPNPKLDRIGTGKEHRTTTSADAPNVVDAFHNRGNIQLVLRNNGTWGTFGTAVEDPLTHSPVYSCVYPKNSNVLYLYVAAMWIGAVVGRDTLVSVGTEDYYETSEFWPDAAPFGDFVKSSIDINSPDYSPDAYSEQDLYCEYTDTLTNPQFVVQDNRDNRPHKPLGIKVHQRTMAWSYSYADDFILFDYQIENIGFHKLENVYIGIFVDGDVWHISREGPQGWNDDIVGFYRTHPAPEGCGFIDTINVAWTADNDGDPENGAWNERSARDVMGARVVRTPSDSLRYAFNWWIINYEDPTRDFGPRRAGTDQNPFRDFGVRLGTPLGDRNRYYVMSHDEFDYDLMFTAKNHSADGWMPPPTDANIYAKGFDTRYLLSFGPFDVNPGQRLPLSFAWVGGENLHQNPSDFERLFDPQNPDVYYSALDFSQLALNSRWASWVYDNPGVDTDGDGYSGKFRVCAYDSVVVDVDTVVTGNDTDFVDIYDYTAADTLFYEGDGIPDFRGAGPPPSPRMHIIPGNGQLTVRFNGYYSETTKDVFSRLRDFEGYRVYVGLDERQSSLALLTSFDLEDYNRYVLRRATDGEYKWVLEDSPFTLDSLRTLYGDPNFDPGHYTRTRPLKIDGDSYYFDAQDFNQSRLGLPGGITKVYPDATRPSDNPDEWTENELTYEHGDPLPRYYEYEVVINDLLPTVPYYVAVTTFDFGSPISGLAALETVPVNNMIAEYPQASADSVVANNLEAYVYPNPYRTDADYAASGFENRLGIDAVERARRIHFANLPPVCTISIYSLDGDLIRQLDHYHPEGGPQSMNESWDLISRNTQAIVSGLE